MPTQVELANILTSILFLIDRVRDNSVKTKHIIILLKIFSLYLIKVIPINRTNIKKGKLKALQVKAKNSAVK